MLFWVKLICPAGVSSSCAMVVMRTGAFIVFCPLRRVAADIYPFFHEHIFQGLARWNPILHTIDPLRHFSSSLGLSSAAVAPLPPCFRKLLDETVKIFAVFPSRLYLLDGEDNCMVSVPKARVTFTIAVGKVVKITRWCPPGLSRCCATHFGSF